MNKEKEVAFVETVETLGQSIAHFRELVNVYDVVCNTVIPFVKHENWRGMSHENTIYCNEECAYTDISTNFSIAAKIKEKINSDKWNVYVLISSYDEEFSYIRTVVIIESKRTNDVFIVDGTGDQKMLGVWRYASSFLAEPEIRDYFLLKKSLYRIDNVMDFHNKKVSYLIEYIKNSKEYRFPISSNDMNI